MLSLDIDVFSIMKNSEDMKAYACLEFVVMFNSLDIIVFPMVDNWDSPSTSDLSSLVPDLLQQWIILNNDGVLDV